MSSTQHNEAAVLAQLGFNPAHCLIDGQWSPPVSGETLPLYNPSTGQRLTSIARGTAVDIDRAVNAATHAFESVWARTPAFERGRIITDIGRRVLDHIEHLALLESLDVGKPLAQARADAVALARYCEFYGGAADKVHGDTIPYLDGYTVYGIREPHGVTGHIVPWNYPMQIIGRSVGAALAMGNTCVLKPAEDACLTALAFADICLAAGLPDGVLNVVPGTGAEAGAALSQHAGIQHISFTGSVPTGAAVQAAAAKNVVPVTLELGGKSPQLVFEDADIESALPFLVNAGIQNAGQTCSASSRLLVQRSLLNTLVPQLAERYRQLRVGPALDDLSVGPLISANQKSRVERFLKEADDLECLARGQCVDNVPTDGFYVVPALYLCEDPSHTLAQAEVFGPVQVVIPFDTEQDAIDIANGTEYGLVAAVWTQNGSRQMRLARDLKAGQVFVNNYGAGGGVELPFGGVGKSGHGREKGFEALYGFSQLKTVAVKYS